MHRSFLLASLLLSFACNKKDNADADDSGIPGVDPSCDAAFALLQDNGSEQTFGACARQGIMGAFEAGGGETPDLREFSYIFRGGGSDDADCWIRWDQEEMCGRGYYPIDNLGSMKWKTKDCPGLPSNGGETISAEVGYASVWAYATRATASGDNEVIMQVVLHGTAADGTTVAGTFQFTELLSGTTSEVEGCTVSTGDDDADGYINVAYGGDDCDDTDVLVHPGSLETCDGVDEDCDGKIDEQLDEYPWYADDDGDGFGDEDSEVTACDGQQPDGYVGQGNDCDDTNPNINPTAEEICDGVDNDCDTVADEGGACG